MLVYDIGETHSKRTDLWDGLAVQSHYNPAQRLSVMFNVEVDLCKIHEYAVVDVNAILWHTLWVIFGPFAACAV